MSNKGKVKFFDTRKGFGFITMDGSSTDVFVHISALPKGMEIREKDEVTFDIENGKKGLNAVNVQLA